MKGLYRIMLNRLLILFMLIATPLGAYGQAQKRVTVYTALDEMYSRPILNAFEEKTGIKVRAVYDSEASKTTGLVSRIMAERNFPRADVFWNNEVAQTILLMNASVIAPYKSPAAEAIPERYKDGDGYWTGFAARGRVIIYNTDLVKEPPTSILDIVDEKWKGRAAIALPLFGTTATHATALFAAWGPENAETYFVQLLNNDVAVLPGNAQVRDFVARGQYAIGLTDTDDANGAIEDGLPVKWIFPDQGDEGMGTLVIPNTVSLISKAPHPEEGKALIDFLLSPETERRLAEARSIQIPLNAAVQRPDNVPDLMSIRTMDLTFFRISEYWPMASDFFQREFLK
jgi:iron(III) transport system substrate-binding protein